MSEQATAGAGPVLPPARRRRRRLDRRVLAVVGVLAVVLLAVLAFTAWQAVQARDALVAAQPKVSTLQDQLTSGDREGAERTLTSLQQDTDQARSNTSGPVWALAARLPWVGDDVTAVRTAAAVTDRVAQDAMPSLVEAASVADPAALAPVDGVIDLAPLQAAQQPLAQARAVLEQADEDVAALDTEGVLSSIAEPVGKLQDALREASATAATASRLANLLPPMLGAEEPRQYLVIFQNNAEVRASGGIPGAFAVLRAEGGRVELVDQGGTGDVPMFDEPVLPLDPEMEEIHTDRLGRYVADINFTPDFPTTAQLAQEMWRRVTEDAGAEVVVDGVVATDPVALSYLLKATGPVDLPLGEQVTSQNAVELLLSQVYQRIERPADQDRFFAATASRVFEALFSGGAEPAVLVPELRRAVDERRLLFWSAREREQAVIEETAAAGRLPTGEAGRSVVGVFLNDGIAGKMSYYLRQQITLVRTCDTGLQTHRLEVTLRSDAPADAAQVLPDYVTGWGEYVPQGMTRTQVLVYAPTGSGLVTASRDGVEEPLVTRSELGRQVAIFTVELVPGQEITLGIGLSLEHGLPSVVSTPLVVPTDTSVSSQICNTE